MSALIAIIFAWLWFGGPVCPPLHNEVKGIYAEYEPIVQITGKIVDGHIEHSVSNSYNISCEMIEGEFTCHSVGKQIGTTTDTVAVEHNKKVRECQIANGEF